MEKRKVWMILVACVSAALCQTAWASSLEKAKMYRNHKLPQEAKREAIELLFSKGTSKSDKAGALDLLGRIALEEGNYDAAIEAWSRLISEFPKSEEAKQVKEKLPTMSEAVGKLSEAAIEDETARSYLKSGDFWSEDRSRVFTIDSSWIPKVDTAIDWYDQVLKEFPGTEAARVAYEHKLMTLLGWKDTGRYGESYGVKADPKKYLPPLEKTFREFEAAFPKASSLQAFRYQIAQAHWRTRDWGKTRTWLKEVIEKDGGVGGFYKDLAERRLKKVEY